MKITVAGVTKEVADGLTVCLPQIQVSLVKKHKKKPL